MSAPTTSKPKESYLTLDEFVNYENCKLERTVHERNRTKKIMYESCYRF